VITVETGKGSNAWGSMLSCPPGYGIRYQSQMTRQPEIVVSGVVSPPNLLFAGSKREGPKQNYCR